MISDLEELKNLEKKIEKLLSAKHSLPYKRKQLKQLKEKYTTDAEQNCIDYYLRRQNRQIAALCGSALCLLLIAGIFTVYFGLFKKAESAYRTPETTEEKYQASDQTPEASEETYQAAITAYEQADYQTVIRNMAACKDAGWDGFAVCQYLADSYYAEGNVEEAVSLLADYLQNTWGTVNIQTNNVLYQRYLTWLPETSEATRDNQKEFTEEAAHYSELYEKARNILKTAGDHGLDACAVELKNAGADNTLFWEIYTSYMISFKGSDIAWEEISPQMYVTDTFHSRQMTYEERWNILDDLRKGIQGGDEETEEWQAVENFEADQATYADCGLGLADIDPANGCDINGKIKNYSDEIAAAKTRFSAYTAIARSPFYEWENTTFYWVHGSEELRIRDTHDDSTKAYEITHTIGYSWMDDLLYQEFICWDLPEEGYLSATLDVQMNLPAFTEEDSENLAALTGTWKLENGAGVRNRELVIHQVETAPVTAGSGKSQRKVDSITVRMEISITDTDTGEEILPSTWLTFEDNTCDFELDGWTFEIILGLQIYCADEEGNDISKSEGIDAVLVMNVETESSEQGDCDGVYLRE